MQVWYQDYDGTKSNHALVGDEFEEVVITGNNLLWVQSGPAALCEMKKPSEETLSLPPNDNHTAGGNVAESRPLHLPHFIFRRHHVLRFHSTTVLFLDASAKHTSIRYSTHTPPVNSGRKMRVQDWCLTSSEICLVHDLCSDAASWTIESTRKQKSSH